MDRKRAYTAHFAASKDVEHVNQRACRRGPALPRPPATRKPYPLPPPKGKISSDAPSLHVGTLNLPRTTRSVSGGCGRCPSRRSQDRA